MLSNRFASLLGKCACYLEPQMQNSPVIVLVVRLGDSKDTRRYNTSVCFIIPIPHCVRLILCYRIFHFDAKSLVFLLWLV